MSKFYPELIEELKREMAMMEFGGLSSGLLSAKKHIERKISKLKF